MKPISYYQNITGDKHEKTNRVGSSFWNEGKWKHYIEPLLPTENRKDMTIVDIGANNGLFLKLAKEAGFAKAIGIEADQGAVKRGIEYRDSLGMDYDLLHREVGKNFDFDEMPVADVYLLSTVHYYFDLNEWIKFIDRMKTKTVYCLIITRALRERKHWRPLTEVTDVRNYFKDWELVTARLRARRKHMEKKGDPSPRVLWSLLFRSDLRRRSFDSLLGGASGGKNKIPRDELIEDVIAGKEIKETSYYKTWIKRLYGQWTEVQIYDFVKQKVETVKNIMEDGVKDPILIAPNGKIIDGGHRKSILEKQGYKSAITRMI